MPRNAVLIRTTRAATTGSAMPAAISRSSPHAGGAP